MNFSVKTRKKKKPNTKKFWGFVNKQTKNYLHNPKKYH